VVVRGLLGEGGIDGDWAEKCSNHILYKHQKPLESNRYACESQDY